MAVLRLLRSLLLLFPLIPGACHAAFTWPVGAGRPRPPFSGEHLSLPGVPGPVPGGPEPPPWRGAWLRDPRRPSGGRVPTGSACVDVHATPVLHTFCRLPGFQCHTQEYYSRRVKCPPVSGRLSPIVRGGGGRSDARGDDPRSTIPTLLTNTTNPATTVTTTTTNPITTNPFTTTLDTTTTNPFTTTLDTTTTNLATATTLASTTNSTTTTNPITTTNPTTTDAATPTWDPVEAVAAAMDAAGLLSPPERWDAPGKPPMALPAERPQHLTQSPSEMGSAIADSLQRLVEQLVKRWNNTTPDYLTDYTPTTTPSPTTTPATTTTRATTTTPTTKLPAAQGKVVQG